ncbi:MAG TPA: hypothetical protein VJO35_06765 [Terriglobales bacterium]|nr:hypothetical protein [Terriglobales bacterium]
MKPSLRPPFASMLVGFALFTVLVGPNFLLAQDEDRPGHSIGRISTAGDLVVMELDEGALGKANLFDLVGRTLQFIPEHARYRVENSPLQWDQEFGAEVSGNSSDVNLHNMSFPFSGKTWNSFRVGVTGWISFGAGESRDEEGRQSRGVSIGRFEPLGEAAGHLFDSAPAICAFFKPRMSGTRYVKELADRIVVTWDLTEPFGNIQDFTWFKTTNRFQAVLKRDGEIDLSYQELAAKDAIVGIYPTISGVEKLLATIQADSHPDLAPHLDVRTLRVSVVDDVVVQVTFETRGPVLQPGDPALQHFAYRVSFKSPESSGGSEQTQAWTVVGAKRPGRDSTYFVFGPGVSREVAASGNTITVRGILPETLRTGRISISGQVLTGRFPQKTVEELPLQIIELSGIKNPEVHLSSLKPKDGPFSLVYESFHYLHLPDPQDLSCTVIKALGDKFDFLAYYSDFRIDNQEAGTPSDGPRGGNVTGIGSRTENLAGYCSQGRFQWGYVQPVYVGANQMQEQPPDGAPVGDSHDVTFYEHQLAESSPDRKMRPYNYAMSQIGHEMGHRWGVDVSAKVNGETIVLGPVHWTRGLQASVAFPYQRPIEASAMGGGVWQDNFDGTFTQLDDDYYVPATGYSYLDLYLMGLISPAEVPDFFILKNLIQTGKDTNGHPIFKADRTKITVQDVIANEGPRQPDVDHSQREFNTGMVLIVEYGKTPSRDLIDRVNGIRKQWIEYWSIATGQRARMTANPQ